MKYKNKISVSSLKGWFFSHGFDFDEQRYNKQTPFPGTCMTDIDGKIESNTYQKSTLDFGVFY